MYAADSFQSDRDRRNFQRSLNGLMSAVLATKKRPSAVRYVRTSDLAKRMAVEFSVGAACAAPCRLGAVLTAAAPRLRSGRSARTPSSSSAPSG
jgi:hypothetical protein